MDADTDGDGLSDANDSDPLNRPEYGDSAKLSDYVGPETAETVAKGVVFGEPGFDEISGSNTIPYSVGWIGGSIVPVFDVFADTRDCLLAWNDGAVANIADCGGAGVSAIASGGTIIGAATSVTGFGAIIGTSSVALDMAEDISDVYRITRAYLGANADDAPMVIRGIKSFLSQDEAQAVVRRIDSGSVPSKAVRAKRAFRLTGDVPGLDTNFDYQTAIAITEAADNLENFAELRNFARVADDIDGFDEISSAGLKADVIKAANDYDELKALDGPALETVVSTRRADFVCSSSVSSTACLPNPEKAADLIRNTDNGADLLNSMDDAAVRSLLRIELPNTAPIDGVDAATALRRSLGSLDNPPVNRIEQFAIDLDRLEPLEIDGISSVARAVAEGRDMGNFIGAATETRYAARNTDTMTALRVDIETPSSGSPGDLDALETLSDGRKLGSEIKNSARNVETEDIGMIRSGLEELIEEGEIDDYQFIFRELSDNDVINYMQSENIPYSVLDQ